MPYSKAIQSRVSVKKKKKKVNVKKVMAPATKHGRRSVYDPGKDQWIHYHVSPEEHKKGSWDSKPLREKMKGYEKALARQKKKKITS